MTRARAGPTLDKETERGATRLLMGLLNVLFAKFDCTYSNAIA